MSPNGSKPLPESLLPIHPVRVKLIPHEDLLHWLIADFARLDLKHA